MFREFKIKRKIKKLKKEILIVEGKRMRSQSALIEAILSGKEASDEDTDYFNHYTAQIHQLRSEIQELQAQLKKK